MSTVMALVIMQVVIIPIPVLQFGAILLLMQHSVVQTVMVIVGQILKMISSLTRLNISILMAMVTVIINLEIIQMHSSTM